MLSDHQWAHRATQATGSRATKEETDFIEREFKFAWNGNEETILSAVRDVTGATAPLVMDQPTTTLDVYFDTGTLLFYRTGATFRMRKRRRKPGWTATFKPPTERAAPHMERREVRTTLTIAEALLYREGKIPGVAASLAYEFATREARDAAMSSLLVPTTYLVSRRDYYLVRPGGTSGRIGNLLSISFDDVIAVALEDRDVASLLATLMVDYPTPRKSVQFAVLEVEASGRNQNLHPQGRALASRIAEVLGAQLGLRPLRDTKYRQASDLLLRHSDPM